MYRLKGSVGLWIKNILLSTQFCYFNVTILSIYLNIPIVFLKRLGSRGFNDLFNQDIFSFHKRYENCKIGACDMFLFENEIKSDKVDCFVCF